MTRTAVGRAVIALLVVAAGAGAAARASRVPAEKPLAEAPVIARIEVDAPQEAPNPDDTPRPPRPRFRIGPEIGFFWPTDDKTRDRFGDSWFNFGIGFGDVSARAEQRGQLLLDVDFYTESRNGNRAIVVPIGLQYRRALSAPPTGRGGIVPYAGASVNLVVVDLRVPAENLDKTRVTGGAGISLGATIGDSGYVEARYLAVGRTMGYNVSGLNVSAGIRF